MNKLQEEMETAVNSHVSDHEITLACASICMKWIEKAIYETFNQVHYSTLHPEQFPKMTCIQWEQKWLKENGISVDFSEIQSKSLFKDSGLTPTEPDTKEAVIGSNGIINGQYKEDLTE